ncbi:hypothetical protein FKW77_006420 [Venturia effusa]|uniref:Uncharacterized protein n=1 Tax=Venturia effusa TaxID=50376 RepID=A0A517KWL6_9PEZI|nr:hypothetical protein FKW77_006420 [Venturia effusa]
MTNKSSNPAAPMPQNAGAKSPPNLITIPPEIRQQILYYTFSDSTDADIRFFMNTCLLYAVSDYQNNDRLQKFGRGNINSHPTPYTYVWAHSLKQVHPILSEELGFVVKRVLDELEFEAFNHPVGGWRRDTIGKDVILKTKRWRGLFYGRGGLRNKQAVPLVAIPESIFSR